MPDAVAELYFRTAGPLARHSPEALMITCLAVYASPGTEAKCESRPTGMLER